MEDNQIGRSEQLDWTGLNGYFFFLSLFFAMLGVMRLFTQNRNRRFYCRWMDGAGMRPSRPSTSAYRPDATWTRKRNTTKDG